MAPPRRNWGRTPPDEFGDQQWVEIVPDPQTGNLDLIYFAALAQCLRLNLGESPIFGTSGIPAAQSVLTQIPPDYYVAVIQQQYAPFFANLVITRAPVPNPPPSPPVPTYYARALAHSGLVLTATIPVAT